MELVFLWINNYKSLIDISFNFSTRFKFTFHSKYNKGNLIPNCKLTYIEKEKYLKNFFDKNGYINISAIVGRNGSGKSSIINFLEKIHILDEQIDSLLVYLIA